jgi:hypothetical protein
MLTEKEILQVAEKVTCDLEENNPDYNDVVIDDNWLVFILPNDSRQGGVDLRMPFTMRLSLFDSYEDFNWEELEVTLPSIAALKSEEELEKYMRIYLESQIEVEVNARHRESLDVGNRLSQEEVESLKGYKSVKVKIRHDGIELLEVIK